MAADKPGILVMYHCPQRLMRELGERYEVFGPVLERSPAALPEGARERVRAILTVGSMVLGGDAMLDALPNLRHVHCYGTGFERIERAALKARGISLSNAADANAAAVADMAMALLLASTRRVAEADRYIRAGKWDRRGTDKWPPITGMSGAKVGILGLGAIGQKVAVRAAAFDAEIGYHSRTKRTDVAWRYLDSALALAEWSDFVVVALRADASNRHIVNAAFLKALGPRGHVVNISRGIAIDEAALADALADGTIAGAGIDVFDEEPKIPPRLMEQTSLVMSPHLGGGTRQAHAAMGAKAVANFDAHFAGKPLVSGVSLD